LRRLPKLLSAIILVSLLSAALASSFLLRRHSGRLLRHHKLIVLGIDGMDPVLLHRFIAQGEMPHFARLAAEGSFLPLQTTIPPQSPVAWSSLITGMNPGDHGIFDFIHRDPSNLTPYFSTARVEAPEHHLRLGKWIIPISTGRVELLRRGKAFWQYLDDHDIPVMVLRMPANFPPAASKGTTLAGLGTPDLLGGYGTFSFYTDDASFPAGPVDGGIIYRVQMVQNRFAAFLSGPPDSFRIDNPDLRIPFSVDRDGDEPVARITIQGQSLILKAGQWSPWVRLTFTFVPVVEKITGICRFYLKQVHPQIELYISPINIDPAAPALPISTPEDYSAALTRHVGLFYTQGIAEDTKALSAGVFSDSEYLEQARMVFDDQKRIFLHELARFHSGLFFYYFSSVDQNSHMFWRAIDPKSPGYTARVAEKYGDVIESYYREMDAMLGNALKAADSNTTVLVVSDHGFAPFRRAFSLNTWLLDNGYLVLREDAEPGPSTTLFGDVDWSKTRAYGLGLNGLYLNLRGREQHGIVNPGPQAEALEAEIASKLEKLRDPKNHEQVITRVDLASAAYSGPESKRAPDMIVGYNRGFRVGWSSVLGGIPARVLEDNTDPWSGDHCIDYTQVPGVVLSNRKILDTQAALTDIAPTVLAEFGIKQPSTMRGHNIFTFATRTIQGN
jgi:predicted AlkP superfamily phosphohydrolase/phosphomutase